MITVLRKADDVLDQGAFDIIGIAVSRWCIKRSRL